MKHLGNQKGETIVEVLIAVTIIASALGGAFAIANRSQNTVQANNERYQAQLYANQQADFLRSYVTQSDANRSSVQTGNLCLTQSGGVLATNTNTSPTSVAAACTLNALYKINFTNTSPSNNTYNVFHITVIWDSLINGSQDQVELYYGT